MDIERLIKSGRDFCRKVSTINPGQKVEYIYNPMEYAAEPYEDYLRRYAEGIKKAVFLGMNPGPWGMAQTGIPFGEIQSVLEWLSIEGRVGTPPQVHEKRPILGFSCKRREVSGKRLWGLMRERFGSPDLFFRDNFVVNYCPLIFFDRDGKNITPDKLVNSVKEELFDVCDDYLIEVLKRQMPHWIIGVGKFAESRAKVVAEKMKLSDNSLPDRFIKKLRVISILHPSPANPHANKGWAAAVTKKLLTEGVWKNNNEE
jgi:single-strand selective monofunctional uracil DNA glycosylase